MLLLNAGPPPCFFPLHLSQISQLDSNSFLQLEEPCPWAAVLTVAHEGGTIFRCYYLVSKIPQYVT